MAQKVIPIVVTLGAGVALPLAGGLFYVPFAVAAAVCAYLFMNNLTEPKPMLSRSGSRCAMPTPG